MAGTVTVAETKHLSIKKIRWAWTSTGGGAADKATANAYSGKLLGLTTDPDGAAAPSDNYDITVTDQDGDDALLGAGANRATATTQHVAEANLGAVAEGPLTLNVAAAGSAKSGVVILWIR